MWEERCETQLLCNQRAHHVPSTVAVWGTPTLISTRWCDDDELNNRLYALYHCSNYSNFSVLTWKNHIQHWDVRCKTDLWSLPYITCSWLQGGEVLLWTVVQRSAPCWQIIWYSPLLRLNWIFSFITSSFSWAAIFSDAMILYLIQIQEKLLQNSRIV